eukprot:COSAG02_NODE_5136_length_4597_cov_2.811027_4_plen_184_part_00
MRISESLAKMRLLDEVHDEHVREAIRIFQVSTLAASKSGMIGESMGFVDSQTLEEITCVPFLFYLRISNSYFLPASIASESQIFGLLRSHTFCRMVLSNETGWVYVMLAGPHRNCEEQIKRRVPRGERVSLQAIENEMVAAVSDSHFSLAFGIVMWVRAAVSLMFMRVCRVDPNLQFVKRSRP